MLSCFSHVQLFATPWTVAHQAPLCMRFSRQEYYSGLPCPPPGDLPDPGIKPASLKSLGIFTTSTTWEALCYNFSSPIKKKKKKVALVSSFSLSKKTHLKIIIPIFYYLKINSSRIVYLNMTG